MSFTPGQIEKLRANLPKDNVTAPKASGPKQSYIKIWRALDAANEIFGHGDWDAESLRLDMCQLETKAKRDAPNVELSFVGYLATVRVTVRHADGTKTIRDDVGFGQGQDQDLGKAHESAAKEAVSDATKRALRTFGWPLGLALYDETSGHVEGGTATTKRPPASGNEAPSNAHEVQASDIPRSPTSSPPREIPTIFGFTPEKAPFMKAFADPVTSAQGPMLERTAKERGISDLALGWIMIALTLALGRDPDDATSKGAHSFGIDFLKGASDESIELAKAEALRVKAASRK